MYEGQYGKKQYRKRNERKIIQIFVRLIITYAAEVLADTKTIRMLETV